MSSCSSSSSGGAGTGGAAAVPRWKRTMQVSGTILHCLFAAGIVFGFAALKPVLKAEGAYRHACAADVSGPRSRDADEDDNNGDMDTCIDMRLNLIFTAATVATNVAALPTGAFLDRFGPRNCTLLGAAFLAVGSVLLACAQAPGVVAVVGDPYLVGYLLLALGGPATSISGFHLSNAFPARSGLILALLTGAFDSSSAVFLGYRVLYEGSNGGSSGGGRSWGLQRFFLTYLAVPLFITIFHVTLMPAESYRTAVGGVEAVAVVEDGDGGEEALSERAALLGGENVNARGGSYTSGLVDDDDATKQGADASKVNADQPHGKDGSNFGIAGMLHGLSAWQQMSTPWFLLICLFTTIQMLRINFFIATIRTQYSFLLASAGVASHVNHMFDAALPLGGVIAIPFVGHIIDSFSSLAVLAFLVSAASVIGILGLIPNSMAAALANVALLVVYRPFFYTAVGDYAVKVFGFDTFGTVYGSLMCIAGLGNFLQSGLDFAYQRVCGGNPFLVNFALFALGLMAGVALVWFVWSVLRRRRRITGDL